MLARGPGNVMSETDPSCHLHVCRLFSAAAATAAGGNWFLVVLAKHRLHPGVALLVALAALLGDLLVIVAPSCASICTPRQTCCAPCRTDKLTNLVHTLSYSSTNLVHSLLYISSNLMRSLSYSSTNLLRFMTNSVTLHHNVPLANCNPRLLYHKPKSGHFCEVAVFLGLFCWKDPSRKHHG